MGGADLPVTMAVLETRARDIAADLGVQGFAGSPGFIQRWASRHRLKSVKLWGQAGSAEEAVRLGERRMAEIREELAAYDPEHIYNMDETGLQYRCLPSRPDISAGRRRRVRGSKAMKAKDRVTLVLACNATGSHKIPVAIIGSAAVPFFFKPPRSGRPLPYFSQKSAWMDGEVHEKWFNTVFVREVRARTRSPVILIVDNCGAHTSLECDGFKICPLPPNVTSIHQPLDAGIIACLKCRYKRRLISLIMRAFGEKRHRPEAAVVATAAAAREVAATGALTQAARPADGSASIHPAAAEAAREGVGVGPVPFADNGSSSATAPEGTPVGAGAVSGCPPTVSAASEALSRTASAAPASAHAGPSLPDRHPHDGRTRVRPSTTPAGIVFGDGSAIDWTPLGAARFSLAVGVGFGGARLDASLPLPTTQPRALPLGQPPSTLQSTTTAAGAAAPHSTRLLVVLSSDLASFLSRTAPSASPGCKAPIYTPPSVGGLPGPTEAYLALAARPNVWAVSLPPTPRLPRARSAGSLCAPVAR
eukprot:TRINITY_DN7135_c0_g1_i1.p1 TRINITY_DN7135_c0_g1~~TRINITY_DN7135_c0_g1_i1.p1  ORF type:complete len:534 (-),score=5.13 TRINITY_DN7135_c0_g1_i1:258-1859(-)